MHKQYNLCNITSIVFYTDFHLYDMCKITVIHCLVITFIVIIEVDYVGVVDE